MLIPGDILMVEFELINNCKLTSYKHFGIFHDYNGNVIHCSKELDKSVRISPFKDFLGDARAFYTINIKETVLRKKILARADSRLNSNNYNVFTNNCEHFVNWCVKGEKECKQLQPINILRKLNELNNFFSFMIISCICPQKYILKLLLNLLSKFEYDIKEKYIYIPPQK
jgi:hypothetical protein